MFNESDITCTYISENISLECLDFFYGVDLNFSIKIKELENQLVIG